jgi:hypothetical protein
MVKWVKRLPAVLLLIALGVGTTWESWQLASKGGDAEIGDYGITAVAGPVLALTGLLCLITPPQLLSDPRETRPEECLVLLMILGIGILHWALLKGWWGQELQHEIFRRFVRG